MTTPAHTINHAIRQTECQMTAELATIVSRHLNQLSRDTGVCVDGVSIRLVDVSTLETVGREVTVGGFDIGCRLPD